MKNKKFLVVKEKVSNVVKVEQGDKKTYKVTPKNKIKVKGTIHVTEMRIASDDLANAIIKRKLTKKMNELILLITDSENETGDTVREALNEVTRYRSILEKKYMDYLKREELEESLRKLDLIEQELKLRKRIYEEQEQEKNIRGKGK